MLGPTARAFGEPMPATYGGKEILACGRRQEMYSQIETEFLRRHPDPMRLYREKVDAGLFPDPGERHEFLKFCTEQACRIQDKAIEDILNWLGTGPGTIFYGTLCYMWPPKDGERWQDLPFLTTEEMTDLFHKQVDIFIHEKVAEKDNWEQAATEAHNAAVMLLHQIVDAASGTDLVGKGTGPTSTGAEGPGR